MTAPIPDLPDATPPEFAYCARCRDNAEFAWNAEEGEFLSVCCTARPLPLDVEPPDEA